jgi:cytidylate kinase
MRNLIIAIDGPSASGKSTTAKLLAKKLNYLYIDTGAMYRAVALKVLRRNIDINNINKIISILENTIVNQEKKNDEVRTLLDGEDVSKGIRTPEVSQMASKVSTIPEVREKMVELQRQMGKNIQSSKNGTGVILDGRDIGTVVFPDADIKIFMVASVQERAKRRYNELQEKGINTTLEEVEKDLTERDKRDSSREHSPLKKADDAIELDNSIMTIDEQVNFVLKEIEKKFGKF